MTKIDGTAIKKNLSNQSHENKESNSEKSTNPFSFLQKDWRCTLEKGGMKFTKKKYETHLVLWKIVLIFQRVEKIFQIITMKLKSPIL